MKEITFDRFVRYLFTIAVCVLLYLLIAKLSKVLTPFFVAWLVAYLLYPIVCFFQYRCKLKFRILGILCTFIVVGALLTGLGLLMIPPIIEEAGRVHDLIIAYVSQDEFMSNIPNMIEEFIHENVKAEDVKAIVTQEGFIDSIKQAVPKVWNVIAQSLNILSSVLMLTMVIIYTLFILLDYEEFAEGWVEMLPQRYRRFAVQLVKDVEQGMNKYFRGQGLV
ncbi:MAG: AI-2E family transporter, partial [Bacteroidaceae bacterium]|nr:AI-2E family transporter [Bacteroidaceae bacterium]